MMHGQRRLYLARGGASLGTRDGNTPDHPYELTLSLRDFSGPDAERWTIHIDNPRPELVALIQAHGVTIAAPLPETIGEAVP